jgi:hypothetical protein
MGFVVVEKDERVVIVVPRSSVLRWFPHFHTYGTGSAGSVVIFDGISICAFHIASKWEFDCMLFSNLIQIRPIRCQYAVVEYTMHESWNLQPLVLSNSL